MNIFIHTVFKAGAPQGSEPLRCKPLQIIYHKTGVGRKKQEFSLEHLGQTTFFLLGISVHCWTTVAERRKGRLMILSAEQRKEELMIQFEFIYSSSTPNTNLEVYIPIYLYGTGYLKRGRA